MGLRSWLKAVRKSGREFDGFGDAFRNRNPNAAIEAGLALTDPNPRLHGVEDRQQLHAHHTPNDALRIEVAHDVAVNESISYWTAKRSEVAEGLKAGRREIREAATADKPKEPISR